MKSVVATACFIASLAAFAGKASAEPVQLGVICKSAACEYIHISELTVGGRDSLRFVPLGTRDVSKKTLEMAPEVKVAAVVAIARDPATGAFYILDQAMQAIALALPYRSELQAGSPASYWSRESFQYRTGPGSGGMSSITPGDFAFFVTGATPADAIGRVLSHQLIRNINDPRHQLLLTGAVRYATRSGADAAVAASILTRIRTLTETFERQTGDPTLLADVISEAATLATLLKPGTAASTEAAVFAKVEQLQSEFRVRAHIATLLRDAGYIDEYLEKLQQLGLSRWAIANMPADSRAALSKAVESHRQKARKLGAEAHFDLAFDEAKRMAELSCDPAVAEEFYSARVLFTNHNSIPRVPEYSARDKAVLEQLVRELEQLDTTKEQLTLERIRRGEELNASFLPLQSKKAEFLDKLGRYREALAVVQRIERNVRLDPKQLEEFLRLDGRISNNLTDAVQKALEQATAQFSSGDFKGALASAEIGLRADSAHAALTKLAALSAAFIRQRERALALTSSFLKQVNLGCVTDDDIKSMLDLNRELHSEERPQPALSAGIPHWISGVQYQPAEAFYDPISLGFLQPVFRIVSEGGALVTLFVREDRSYMVRSITTSVAERANSVLGSRTILFEAEPRYDRTRASMLEIGSKATSVGERVAYPLVYWNSPTVDAALVARFTGKQTTRGWAGNPYFHPFIWNGIYTFDLTYDRLGRVSRATPRQQLNGQRTDPLSEPLEFVWEGDTKRLLTVRGTTTGYLRELRYDKNGRLRSEEISTKSGHGSIKYEYVDEGPQLKAAEIDDDFWDRRQRRVLFDVLGQR